LEWGLERGSKFSGWARRSGVRVPRLTLERGFESLDSRSKVPASRDVDDID
jgi:hypothetical protein